MLNTLSTFFLSEIAFSPACAATVTLFGSDDFIFLVNNWTGNLEEPKAVRQQSIFFFLSGAGTQEGLALKKKATNESHNYKPNFWQSRVTNLGGSFVAVAYSALQGNTLSTT